MPMTRRRPSIRVWLSWSPACGTTCGNENGNRVDVLSGELRSTDVDELAERIGAGQRQVSRIELGDT